MGLFGDGIKGGHQYKMRESVFGIGEDFWVEDENGDKAFKVDGKALRMRKTFVIESRDGAELYTVKERKLTIRDTMAIERDGDTIAKVKKGIGIGDRYVFEADDKDYKAKGEFLSREYKIEREGDKVAEVSKKFFSLRDCYGIHVADGVDAALIIAAVACIEELAKDI